MMKIHIMGASCAGSTTLGKALSERFGFTYFDTDSFFWEQSDPPFTIRRDSIERNGSLIHSLASRNNWILGGSLVNWGLEGHVFFDLVIFLYVPLEIRMQRLKVREMKIHGSSLVTNTEMAAKFENFVAWAQGYDNNTTKGRNLAAHRSWLDKLTCPVLKIEGDTTLENRIDIVSAYLRNITP